MIISVLDYQSYSEFLRSIYFHKMKLRTDYTMATFGVELGVDPSILNRLLNKQRGPSRKNALKICESLFETEEEKDHFLDLVEMDHARSLLKREQARHRVIARFQNRSRTLGLNELRIMNSWIDFALRHCTYIFDIMPGKGLDQAADYLGVSISEIRASFDKLLLLKLVKLKAGYYRPCDDYIQTQGELSSKIGRDLNKQLIEKSLERYEQLEKNQRFYTSLVMAIDQSQVELAQRELESLLKKINRKLTAGTKGKDAVYCLGLQFFELGSEKK